MKQDGHPLRPSRAWRRGPETAAAGLGQALPSQPNTRRGQERVLTELLCVRVRVCGRSGLAECNRLGGTWMDFSGQRVNQELYGQVLHTDVDGRAGRQLAREAQSRVQTNWDGESHIAGFSGVEGADKRDRLRVIGAVRDE